MRWQKRIVFSHFMVQIETDRKGKCFSSFLMQDSRTWVLQQTLPQLSDFITLSSVIIQWKGHHGLGRPDRHWGTLGYPVVPRNLRIVCWLYVTILDSRLYAKQHTGGLLWGVQTIVTIQRYPVLWTNVDDIRLLRIYLRYHGRYVP